MLYLLLDIIIVAVLIFSVLRGHRRGFIMTISSFVIIIAAFIGAGLLAKAFSPAVSTWIEPHITERVTVSLDHTSGEETQEDLSLSVFGISLEGAKKFGEKLGQSVDDVMDSAVSGAARSFSGVIAYSAVSIAAFILLVLLLNIVFRAADLVSRLPGLNLINRALGIAAGAATGMLLIFVGISIAGIFDSVISPEVIEKTVLYKFFAGINPFSL